MRLTIIIIILLITVMGCMPVTTTHIPKGKAVSAPWGWTDYCKRYPEDPACSNLYERK